MSERKLHVRNQYYAFTQQSEYAQRHLADGAQLIIGVQRSFEKSGRQIPQGGTLITLGCGEEPYLPAFHIFHPTEVIGTDIVADHITKASAHWKDSAAMFGFPSRFVTADAIQPSNVLSQAKPVASITNVVLLHPGVEANPESTVDEDYLTMVKNWLPYLSGTGYITISTYTSGELLIFLSDPEIQSHLVTYGTTGVLNSSTGEGNIYIALLQKEASNTPPVRLRNFEHYVQDTLSDIPGSTPEEQADGLLFVQKEAEALEAAGWEFHHPDAPEELPKDVRRKSI